jgi:hypothetical protein
MALKSNTHHPSFIIGVLSFVLLICGIVLKGSGFKSGDYVDLAAVVFGGIHWVWSITDVLRNRQLTGDSRIFWIIVVMLVPPVGGMLYYLMKRKPLQI